MCIRDRVEAMQQAEIDQVEAKYDVLIQEAENNGEDTAALEEEKENKKLEIQKKYADCLLYTSSSGIRFLPDVCRVEPGFLI